MRQPLATLLLGTALGGCSLLYNPSNLPPVVDAMPDAEMLIDADPTMLHLTGVKPAALNEGAGDHNSRSAVLVIDGMDLVSDGAMVTVAPSAGSTTTPMVMVDNSKISVEGNGMRLAVPITLPVDPAFHASDMPVKMDVTVTQLANGTQVSQTIAKAFTISGLDEIDDAAAHTFTSGPTLYSYVNIRMGGSVAIAAGQTEPIIIHSTSAISIHNSISIALSGSAQTPGPAGGRGGDAGAGGLVGGAAGGEGGGPAKGTPSGGGGGFTGDAALPSLGNPNRSSGGAGGDGMSLGAAGGAGGAGGGSIALIADGDLSAGTITSKGDPGTAPANANPGGGGSGGVVYAQAGGTLMLGAVDVTGGRNGAAGRARYDARAIGTVASASSMFRGPAFVDAPLITTEEKPAITVVGTPLKPFQFYWTNDTGASIRGPISQTFPMSGTTTLAFPDGDGLFRGLDTLCLLVAGADATSETKQCISLAFMFSPTAP